jgi:hypothetical protein
MVEDIAEQLIDAYLDEKKLHPSMHKWTIKQGGNKPQKKAKKKTEVVGPAGPRRKSLAQKQGPRKAARTRGRRQYAQENKGWLHYEYYDRSDGEGEAYELAGQEDHSASQT